MENIRQYRIAGIAIFDVVGTIFGLFIFRNYIFPYFFPNQPFWIENQAMYYAFGFLVGILTHLLFGIPTTLNYYLGLSQKP